MHKTLKGGMLAGAFLLAAAFSPVSAAPADTTLDTTDYLLDDFDDQSASTPWWGFWFTFTDRNSKTVDTALMGNSFLTTHDSVSGTPLYDSLGFPLPEGWPRGHTGDSLDYGMRMGYVLGDRPLSCGTNCTYAPYVGLGVGFTTQGGRFLNLRGATHFTFWAKADSGTVVVNVAINDTNTASEDYAQRFVIDSTWKKYSVALEASAALKQPEYGGKGPFDKTIITGAIFGINKGDNALRPANGITLDDVTIENWKFVDPIPPPPPEDPISVRKRLAGISTGFKATRRGNVLRVRMPSSLAGKTGILEAVNATGKVLGRTGFGPSGDVEFHVEGPSQGLYFRVISAASRR